MSSILRFSRLFPTTLGLVRPTRLPLRAKKIICKDFGNFNLLKQRRQSSTAVAVKKEMYSALDPLNLEKLIYQLSYNVKSKKVTLREFNEVFEIIKQKGEITHSELMLLLRCCTNVLYSCSEEERVKMANSVWESAQELGCELNIGHYNVLLAVFIDNNYKFSLEDFLNTLKEKNIEPNAVTYKRLLKACCQQGDIETAKILLEIMKDLDYPLSERDFCALVQVYSEINDFSQAEEILKVMKEKEISPGPEAYVYILCGYAKHGKINEFNKQLNKLREQNINLSAKDILEIMYSLIIHNQIDTAKGLLEKINLTFFHNRDVFQFLTRLLHKKLDSVALDFGAIIGKGNSLFDSLQHRASIIINHFVQYRNPDEILNICAKLESSGYTKASVSFAWKQVVLNKDLNFCLNFITGMKTRNIPVKNVHFWPLIIRASKNGNEELMNFLKKTKRTALFKCYDTVFKIIFSNFNFSDNWRSDLATFEKIGVPPIYTSAYEIQKLLGENKLDEANVLVKQTGVSCGFLRKTINSLFDCYEKFPEKTEQVCEIVFALAHDLYLDKLRNSTDKVPDNEIHLFFKYAVEVLLKSSVNKETQRQFLENMLKRKMSLPSDVVNVIVESFPDENVTELAKSLTESNLKFEYDSSLLNVKKKNYTFHEKDEEDKRNHKNLLKMLDSYATLDECLNFALATARKGHLVAAYKILKDVCDKKKDEITGDFNFIYKYLVVEFAKSGQLDKAFEVFNLGLKYKLIKEKDVVPIMRMCLERDDTSKAVEIFYEYIIPYKSFHGYMELMSKFIKTGNTQEIENVTQKIAEEYDTATSLSLLTLAFVYNQEIQKATKLLKTQRFKLNSNIINSHLRFFYKNQPVTFFEEFLEVIKEADFDRVFLYKILVNMYSERNETEKLKDLWVQVMDDNVSDYSFLKAMSDLMSKINNPKSNSKPDTVYKDELHLSQGETKQSSVRKNENSLLSSAQNIQELYNTLNKSPEPVKVNIILRNMLANGQVSEFCDLLNLFVEDGEHQKIENCFYLRGLARAISNDKNSFEKFKDVALKCWEKSGNPKPLVSLLVTSLKNISTLKNAEELVNNYSEHLKKVSFEYVMQINHSGEKTMSFYENLLKEESVKKHFSDNLSTIYEKIIAKKCRTSSLRFAVKYAEMAAADNVVEKMNPEVIQKLKNLVDNKNLSLPDVFTECK